MLTVDNAKKFDWKKIPLDDCMEGNALDAFYTIKIYKHLLEELKKKNLEGLFEKLISPSIPIFRDMEYDGLLIDTKKLAELKEKIQEKLKMFEHNLTKSEGVPSDANFGSDRDLIKILYSLDKDPETKEWIISDAFGFQLYPFNKTDKGQPQTNDETLVLMRDMIEKEYSRRGLNAK
jgi:DNA polymerase I-like protein with 3'-5' exonuclease and polymerase domains